MDVCPVIWRIYPNCVSYPFGIDQVLDPPIGGRIYAKGGYWGDGRCVEQSNVFFLPKGMELVILANSPFCKPGDNFMGNVLDVIQKNIENSLFTLTVTAVSALYGVPQKLDSKDNLKQLILQLRNVQQWPTQSGASTMLTSRPR